MLKYFILIVVVVILLPYIAIAAVLVLTCKILTKKLQHKERKTLRRRLTS